MPALYLHITSTFQCQWRRDGVESCSVSNTPVGSCQLSAYCNGGRYLRRLRWVSIQRCRQKLEIVGRRYSLLHGANRIIVIRAHFRGLTCWNQAPLRVIMLPHYKVMEHYRAPKYFLAEETSRVCADRKFRLHPSTLAAPSSQSQQGFNNDKTFSPSSSFRSPIDDRVGYTDFEFSRYIRTIGLCNS